MLFPVNQKLLEKLTKLEHVLASLKRVVIAYSGGVDSTFLIKIAYDVLGANALAVTICSPTFTEQECIQAQQVAEKIGIPHVVIEIDQTTHKSFIENPPNRCYYCKKILFRKVRQIAYEKNISVVLDGSNADDEYDYRPGQKALKELCIQSPLKDAGLTKNEIRQLSKKYHLPTWNAPANACLASRFPYGIQITKERLLQVQQAENYLKKFDVQQVRVRHHVQIARIEVKPTDFTTILRNAEQIARYFKQLGFQYISLDIEGYHMGGMNKKVLV